MALVILRLFRRRAQSSLFFSAVTITHLSNNTMSYGANLTASRRPYVDISGIPYSTINSLNPVTSSSTMRCKSSA